MLQLSADQLESMGTARRDDFTARLEGFLAPAAGVEPMPGVPARLDAARHLGLSTEREAATFVSAGEVLGRGFHNRIPAAVAPLRLGALPQAGKGSALRGLATRVAAVLDRAAPAAGGAADPTARSQLSALLRGTAQPAPRMPVFAEASSGAGTAAEGARLAQSAVERATAPADGGGQSLRSVIEKAVDRVESEAGSLADQLTRPVRELRDDARALRDSVLDLPAAAREAVEAAKDTLRGAGQRVLDAVEAEAWEAAGEIGDTAAAGAKRVRDAVAQAAEDMLAGHAMDLGAIRCAVEDLVSDVLDKVDSVLSGLAGRLWDAAVGEVEAMVGELFGRIELIRAKLDAIVGSSGTLVEKVGRLFDNIARSFDQTDFSALITPCPQRGAGDGGDGGGGGEQGSAPTGGGSQAPPAGQGNTPRPAGAPRTEFPVPVARPPAPTRPAGGTRTPNLSPATSRGPVLPAPPPGRPAERKATPAAPRPGTVPPLPPRAPVTPREPELTPAEQAELNELMQDLGQAALDVVGIFDPTGAADVANAGWSALRGDWLGAGVSLLGVVPLLGDMAKVGKLPKMLASVERALALSARSAAARRVLGAPLDALRKTIGSVNPNALPRALREPVQKLQAKLAGAGPSAAAGESGAARVVPHRNIDVYVEVARRGDFSTRADAAVFWSGAGNRNRAEFLVNKSEIANPRNGLQTLETTRDGKFLDGENLFSTFDRNDAIRPFVIASERFATQAKGRVTAVVRGSSEDSIFRTVEMPILLKNRNVSEINGIPRVELEHLPLNEAFKRIERAAP